MHLVQIELAPGKQRTVARVDGGKATTVPGSGAMRDLALAAIAGGRSLSAEVEKRGSGEAIDYAAALKEGRVLPPLDHPDPTHCLITGTGLTHLGSAEARDKMHAKLAGGEENLSDSLKMFKMGLEGGKPKGSGPGVQPEWFYKGDGTALVRPGAEMPMPGFALDGGEEPEVTGLYVIGTDGKPWRLGFALGNEFSDHVTERQNYLWLAHSKLRACSIGPELLVGDLPRDVRGTSKIVRAGRTVWEKPFLTGEENMSHTIANLEGHHFKYELFRQPGDVHVHYFGTATLSVSDGVKTEPGDVFEIVAEPFGLPLTNPIGKADAPWAV